MNENETPVAITATHTMKTNALDRIADPVVAVEKMGGWFAKSGMFGCEKPEQGMILALAAVCERKSPLEIADTYHIIGGQLSMKSRAVLARYRQAGGKVKWIKSDDKTCEADWTFEGETTRVAFKLEEAKRMGLVRDGSNWMKSPAEMLRARCTTRAITMLAPEILLGAGAVEDVAEAAPAPAPNPIPQTATATTAEPPKDPTPPKRGRKPKAKPAGPPMTAAEKEAKAAAAKKAAGPDSARSEERAAMRDQEAADAPEATEGGTKPPVDENAADAKAAQMEKAAAAIEEGVEPADQLISVEQIKSIMELCEDCEQEADAWLVGKKWIKESGALKTMTAANAKRILDAPDKFVRAAKKAASKK